MVQLTLANVSKHLTEDVIDKVFKIKTDSEDSVTSVEVTSAAPAGEGLISAVYRIRVTGNYHRTNFIAKGLVQDLLLRKSLKCALDFFKREVQFFTKILPVFVELQKTFGAKETIQSNLPVCYVCHVDGENDFILMEDLSEKEYVSLSEHPTISERDMCLHVLAHLHSVSFALRIKKPDIFAKVMSGLNEVYYNEDNQEWFTKYLERALEIDKTVLAEVDGTDGFYYKKFAGVIESEDVYGQLIKLAATRGDYPVLSHGDAWCPNFLCCKQKAIMIDFQLVRCASVATDLCYFMMLCSNQCPNKEQYMEAIKVYYRALKYYLRDMGLDADEVFPFKTLQREIKEYGKFGVFAALTSIPLMASERCDVLQSCEAKYAGYDRIPLEELWRLTPITSEYHRTRLVNAVRVAIEIGLI